MQAVGTWNGAALVLATSVPPVNWIGLQFVIPTTLDATIGTPLALILHLWTAGGAFGFPAGTLTPYIVPEANPAPYSNVLLPGGRNEILGGTPMLPVAGDGAGTEHQITIDVGVLAPWVRSSLWRGVISLSLEWVGGLGRAWNASEGVGIDPTQVPRITTIEHPFHSGFINFHQEERGFAALDDRLGTPILSTHRVSDRYIPNLLVHPDDVDPEDPPNRYRPNPREGVNEDDRDV
jgi:hypothetical protein